MGRPIKKRGPGRPFKAAKDLKNEQVMSRITKKTRRGLNRIAKEDNKSPSRVISDLIESEINKRYGRT